MYKNSGSERKKPDKKALFLLVSLALLLSLAIGGTLAYLKAETPAVKNTFAVGQGGAEIIEEISGTEKSSVIVKNTGSVPSYVRVAVIVNNVDDKGNVLSSQTEAINYNSKNWQYLNGCYYYKGIVPPNGSTENLLNGTLDFNNKTVDIMAQTIQSAGKFEQNGAEVSAAKLSWGADYDGTNWS